MIGGAIVVGYVVRPSPPEQRELAPVFKVAVLVCLAIAMVFLVRMTNNFLARAGVDEEGGITDTLQNTTFRTQEGGSSFQPSVLDSPTRVPVAVVTVLFRPLIPEANERPRALAAAEGTALLAWSIWRWRLHPHAGLSIPAAAVRGGGDRVRRGLHLRLLEHRELRHLGSPAVAGVALLPRPPRDPDAGVVGGASGG